MRSLRLFSRQFAIALAACASAAAQDVTFTIDASHDAHAIPDAVYGVNDLGFVGSTIHRHGGNRHTGLNWENNASNAGTDYLNSSDSYLGSNAGIGSTQTPGALLQAWVNADRAQNLRTILTLPLAGYVAADMNGSVASGEAAPSGRWKQVVVNKSGALSLTPETADNVVYLSEMVNFLIAKYGTAASGGVAGYALDNEPALWPSTHPRIHPNKPSYQELVAKHSAAAAMATALDASAEIYGPVAYGWNEHLNLQDAPDANTFNGTYGTFTNYYLAQMKSASDAAGRRLLHRYDIHWYPEAQGDHRITDGGATSNNDIDARLQAPRSLWDPAYVETSWITQWTTNGQGIRLLPRLQESVDQYFPGTGLALTEYNYGGADHISGGVAQADVLGIFGRYQVTACFWPLSDANDYVTAAFKLYRNYDNAGAQFGSISLNASVSDNAKAAVHAARNANGTVTVVAINRSRTQTENASFQFTMPAGKTADAVRIFRLSSSGGAQLQSVPNAPTPTANSFSDSLPPMSATLYEVHAATAAAATQQYSIGSPTNDQQYALELINRARANADAEAIRFGLSGRQEGPPNYNGEVWTIQNATQPLSWNPKLAAAAQDHSKTLNDADQAFSGQSPHTFGGTTPDQRIAAAGYQKAPYSGPTTQNGFYPGNENVAEAISQGSGPYAGAKLTAAVLDAHNGLFTDNGMFGGNAVPGRGHRNTMTLAFFREIGIGITPGTDTYQGSTVDSFYEVQDFGTEVGSTPFTTGVVFNDGNGNGFYDPGEGIEGVRVDVTGSNYFAVSSSSGGYSVPVPGNGSYTVTFSGGPVPTARRSAVATNGANVKVDYAPARLANISTRLVVQTGDNALIGGFIITGNEAKKVILRAIGPSLSFPNRLANPTLELLDVNGTSLEMNDDWQQSPNKQAIIDSTIPPSDNLESAIVRTLAPGAYTAIVRGVNDTTGVGVVEVYDLDSSTDSKLANISTRGRVETGDNVLIGGTIVTGPASQKVLIRALGPSLNIAGSLSDPTLELRNSNGDLLFANDNWRNGPQQAEIAATTIPPPNDAESAVVATLAPGGYTAVVSGAGGATGLGVVEVYALNN